MHENIKPILAFDDEVVDKQLNYYRREAFRKNQAILQSELSIEEQQKLQNAIKDALQSILPEKYKNVPCTITLDKPIVNNAFFVEFLLKDDTGREVIDSFQFRFAGRRKRKDT